MQTTTIMIRAVLALLLSLACASALVQGAPAEPIPVSATPVEAATADATPADEPAIACAVAVRTAGRVAARL